ncbi:Uncharacterized protein QTN25_003510 [Entamoeba marina]
MSTTSLSISSLYTLQTSESLETLKRRAKKTVLDTYFTSMQPIPTPIHIIQSVSNFITNKDITTLPIPLLCEEVENMIEGGVDGMEAMRFGKLFSSEKTMTFFFESIKPSNFYRICMSDKAKTLRLFLFALSKQNILSSAINSLVNDYYLQPFHVTSPAIQTSFKQELPLIVNYRIGDVEDQIAEMKRSVSNLETDLLRTRVEPSEFPIKKHKTAETQYFSFHIGKVVVVILNGDNLGNVYVTNKDISDDIDYVVNLDGDTVNITNSLNTFETHLVGLEEQVVMIWTFLNSIELTKQKKSKNILSHMNSSISLKDNNEEDDVWKTFDNLLI